jgi:hypothetical protein
LPRRWWQIFIPYLSVLQVISNDIALIEREGANNFLEPVCVENFWSTIEYDQRVIARFLHSEGVHPDQIHARLTAQFGSGTDNLRSVQRWCQYVRQGREEMDDEERSGRLSLRFIDSKIIARLDREPFIQHTQSLMPLAFHTRWYFAIFEIRLA